MQASHKFHIYMFFKVGIINFRERENRFQYFDLSSSNHFYYAYASPYNHKTFTRKPTEC